VTGTVEGDVVWDSTGDDLYVYDGSAFVQMNGGAGGSTLQAAYTASTSPEITVDGTRKALTLRDVASPTHNVFEVESNTNNARYFEISATGTKAYSVGSNSALRVANVSGTTQDVLYVSDTVSTLTTGNLLMLDGGSAYTTGTILSATGTLANNAGGEASLYHFQANLSPSNGTTTGPGGMRIEVIDGGTGTQDTTGLDLRWSQQNNTAHSQYVGRIAATAVATPAFDQTIDSLLLLENLDTAAGNLITVTDALRITSTTAAGITNGVNITSANITNGFVVSAGVTTAFSVTSTSVTTDLLLQRGATIDNDSVGQVNVTATTLKHTTDADTEDAFWVAGNTVTSGHAALIDASGITSGYGLLINGGNAMNGGSTLSATGTLSTLNNPAAVTYLTANYTAISGTTGVWPAALRIDFNDEGSSGEGTAGLLVNFNPQSYTVHDDYGIMIRIPPSVAPLVSDHDVTAMLFLQNDDAAGRKAINGIQVRSDGTSGMNNAFHIDSLGAITNGYVISGIDVTNGINFSAATSMTRDFILQAEATIDNATTSTLTLTSTTTKIVAASGATSSDVFWVAANSTTSGDLVVIDGSGLTSGSGIVINAGNAMTSGTALSATGTLVSSVGAPGALAYLHVNHTATSVTGGVFPAGLNIEFNDEGAGTTAGLYVEYQPNSFNTHDEYGIYVHIPSISAPASDLTVKALGYFYNDDSGSGDNLRTVESGILIDNRTTGGMLNAYNVDPLGSITNGYVITGSGITTGLNFEPASGMTSDIALQFGETIDNASDGVVNVTANTFKVTGSSATVDSSWITNSALTSGDLMYLEGGVAMGSGSVLSATGTIGNGTSAGSTPTLALIHANLKVSSASAGANPSALRLEVFDTGSSASAFDHIGLDIEYTIQNSGAHPPVRRPHRLCDQQHVQQRHHDGRAVVAGSQ
jgi:hypothetical protein